MTVEEALEFFAAIPAIKNKLQTFADVGLTYITLGQSATTYLGERLKELSLPKSFLKEVPVKHYLYWMNQPQVFTFMILNYF